jgi:hypothetical protein
MFWQGASMSGRTANVFPGIAERVVELIVQKTTERDFSKHLTVTSGRRHSRFASPG